MNRKEEIEKILLFYGCYVLIKVKECALKNEHYEDCKIISDLLSEHRIDENMGIEDYQAEFWKLGKAGEIAVGNIPFYIDEAIKILYNKKQIIN